MNLEINPNWQPPSKDHGGENIPDLFARMLLNEIVGIMYAKLRKDLPIENGIDEILDEMKSVNNRLREKGEYFYDPEGSIFMDYKIMREQAYRTIGNEAGKEDTEEAIIYGNKEVKSKFSPEMPVGEALYIAREIVDQWWTE